MTKKTTDPEFRLALFSLLETFYSGTQKALALDLEVEDSTVSRWKNQESAPSEQGREKVFNLLREQEEKNRKLWIRRAEWVLAQARLDVLKAIQDILDGKKIEELDPVIVGKLSDLSIKSKEVIR